MLFFKRFTDAEHVSAALPFSVKTLETSSRHVCHTVSINQMIMQTFSKELFIRLDFIFFFWLFYCATIIIDIKKTQVPCILIGRLVDLMQHHNCEF